MDVISNATTNESFALEVPPNIEQKIKNYQKTGPTFGSPMSQIKMITQQLSAVNCVLKSTSQTKTPSQDVSPESSVEISPTAKIAMLTKQLSAVNATLDNNEQKTDSESVITYIEFFFLFFVSNVTQHNTNDKSCFQWIIHQLLVVNLNLLSFLQFLKPTKLQNQKISHQKINRNQIYEKNKAVYLWLAILFFCT